MRHRLIFISGWIAALVASVASGAQNPLNAPVPLLNPPSAAITAGDTTAQLISAKRALELGFPATAAEVYRELLKRPGTEQRLVTLALSAALIADNRAPEAEALLRNFDGYRGAAWHLYAGLAAVQMNRIELARGEPPAVREKESELTPEERGWWFFLQGMLAEKTVGPERTRALTQANGFYEQAVAAATSTYARVRFQIARAQALQQLRVPTAAELEQSRQTMEAMRGRDLGYRAAETLAVGLNAQGSRDQALAVLNEQLLGLPAQERAREDGFRLLIGMIAGAGDGVGRNALLQLLRNGRDIERQRIALQLLAEKSTQEPVRGQFRAELTRLISAPTPHPIQEDLLLFRANFWLAEKNFGAAEEDARTLLDKFPGSALKPLALAVLTSSAWEQRRYRTVVESAMRAIEAQAPAKDSPSGKQARAELNVLVAEAWFRAGDFRSAADAYAEVLRSPPAGAKLGDLMFQRVQAEIEVPSLEAAQSVLDSLAANPAFDAENRWQAEWNLARALIAKADPDADRAAFARVNALVDAPPNAGVNVELRARMRWLQARLALDTGDPKRAIELVSKSLVLTEPGLSQKLRDEIRSTATLIKAQASFALNDEKGAIATLEKLRADFPKTEAAVLSYVAQARYYAENDKSVEAQRFFNKLADEFPDHELAPQAIYQAALQAESRGNLEEANSRLEALLDRYKDSSLVFDARLKQGDLMRGLNQFPQAQRAYELLVNSFASRPDVVLAQLALAKCHNAQALSDPGHAETALSLFERVRERVDAPIDARVEAGYNRGLMLAGRSEVEKAAAAWWVDVVTPFLLDPVQAEKLGANGRLWMSRTLLDLGDLRQSQGKTDEAKKAWEKILECKLPGDADARVRLTPYGMAGGRQ